MRTKYANVIIEAIVILAIASFFSCGGNRTDANQRWIDSDSIATATLDSLEALLDSTMPHGADELFNDFFFNFLLFLFFFLFLIFFNFFFLKIFNGRFFIKFIIYFTY